MATINVDKFYVALIEKDEIGLNNLKFGTPDYIPGIQQFTAKTKTNTGENYEEGVLVDQDTTLQDVELSINLGHLSNAQYAKYLGHHMAAQGGVYALEGDVSPWIAILVEYTKSGGKKGFKIFYKGMFTEPDDSAKQKEGKISYENITVTATFQPLKNNGMWKYTIEEDDDNCPEDIETKFFQSVIIPAEATEEPLEKLTLVSSNPKDSAINVALDVNPSITFNNKIADNEILLLDDSNSIMSINKSLDITGKIITIVPSAALTANKKYSILVTGVKDIFEQELAQSTIGFTTATA